MTAERTEATSLANSWLGVFEQDPGRALADLISGHARLHPYERLDAPDAAHSVFGWLSPADPSRRQLDQAMKVWLEGRRQETPPSDRPALQRWVREASEALEIVSLLDLFESASDLRRRFIAWNEWAQRFSLSPARDIRARYWRTLAQTQLLVTAAPVEPVGGSLAPFWRQICEESGGRLPGRYLSIGLLGLRRLPTGEDASDVAPVAGLAHWALAQKPTEAAFKAQWYSLKGRYVRTPTRWRKIVDQVLSTHAFTEAGIEPPEWWRCDPIFEPFSKPGFKATGASVREPTETETNRVIADIASPFEQAEPQVNALMREARRYANLIGDDFSLVRVIHRIGMALLREGGDQPEARATLAQSLAREGINWSQNNPYLWSLLRESLLAKGNITAAEMVAWDSVRRDPSDAEAPAQLATLLGKQPARRTEAELLLKRAMERFPTDRYISNQLAELLIVLGRTAEARALVEESIAVNRTDGATFALYARLLVHAGEHQHALRALDDGIQFHNGQWLVRLKNSLMKGERLTLQSNLFAQLPMSDTPVEPDSWLSDVITRGNLRRIRFLMDNMDGASRDIAVEELKKIREDNPSSQYAALLTARYEGRSSETLPTFAVAFELALAEADQAKLRHLAHFHPKLEALILVAQAMLGDTRASAELDMWLAQPPAANEDRTIGLLRQQIGRLAHQPSSGARRFVWNDESRSEVLQILRDTNEASISDKIAA